MHKLLRNSFVSVSRTVKLSSHHGRRRVLGIETSCDDTGAAVVDEDGNILGEAINSQTKLHIEMGGILPVLARDLHKAHIDSVVKKALNQAKITVHEIDAIATTVKPGLMMSLDIGMKYTRNLIEQSGKPFIPIHHMEAHALTARMINRVPFPFLVLLVSGGHCLLAVAKEVDDFLLLGKSEDMAPGDAFDKIARTLRLKNLPECQGRSGGESIEIMAKYGDPKAYVTNPKMHRHYNCNFSFSGVRTKFEQMVRCEEITEDLKPGCVLSSVSDICASFQFFILKHLSNRIQRAILYCHQTGILNAQNTTLVMSGGVASNQFLRQGIQQVCDAHNTRLVCPPPKLCTDNGIMIAWNGVEKLRAGIGIENIDDISIQPKCPLGEDVSAEISKEKIKIKPFQWKFS